MKVLIADKLSPQTVVELQQLGLEVTVQAGLSEGAITQALAETEILIVRSTKVTAEAIAAAPRLSLIVRAGAGVNTIDVAAASSRGIYVANCPGMNTAAVAELAIGLLVAADRRVVDATQSLREGRWKKGEFGKAAGLKGRTLGILGFGAIGRAVARAAQGLDMNVVAWSRSLTDDEAEQADVVRCESPLELAGKSDAVSIHLPASDDTRHLVNAAFFDAMRDGAILINTARGELVDSDALMAAIARKHLRVGLDVFEDEPSGGEGAFDQQALAELVTATPHIGASTNQAAEAIAAEVVRIVRAFVDTGHPCGVVNLAQRTPATHHLVVRHLNRVGVLAGVLDGLRGEGINVEEMNNSVFAGAEAACCTLALDAPPSDQLLAAIRQDNNILQLLVQPHDGA